jgi:hypothetical protein
MTYYELLMELLTKEQAVEMFAQLRHETFKPPPGWFIFGTHLDYEGPLEFWGTDVDGLPIWERPAL